MQNEVISAVTNARNVGTGDHGLFKQRLGKVLEFKKLTPGLNGVEMSEIDDALVFDLQQDLKDTASPTFDGLTIMGLNPGSVLFIDNANQVAEDSLFVWDATNHALGIGVTVPTAPVDVAYTSPTTNNVFQIARFNRKSSGVPANGIGVGIEMQCQTNVIFNPVIANMNFVSTDVTLGSEDFDYILRLARAGTLTDALKITSTGQILPNNIHNNGGLGNSTIQAIASGEYTPTAFNITNVAASTVGDSTWIRVGNAIVAGGRFTLDPTAASVKTEIEFSPPATTDLSLFSQVGGGANCLEVTGLSGGVRADITNNRFHIEFINGTDIANRVWSWFAILQIRP